MKKQQIVESLQTEVAALKLALEKATSQMLKLPQLDSLTKLPNKALFYDRLTQAIARTRRNKKLMAVIYLDISYSKLLTAKWGESAKDALIKEFATRFKSLTREVDTLARLDDHRFAIIMEEAKNASVAEGIVVKLLQHADRGFTVNDEEIAVGTTISVAFYDNVRHMNEDLVGMAKETLARAKKEKRGYLLAMEN